MTSRKTVSLGGSKRLSRGIEDATPERLSLARARGIAEVDGQGVRRLGDPFDALHARSLLDRSDPGCNALLWQAGERLRRHWHGGRLDNLTAFDFTRDSVDVSGTPGGTSPTETALRHRDAYRAAADAVGSRLMPYLSGLVVEARTVAEMRVLVTDTGHPRTADALVIERLREGLHRLCTFWRMTPDTRPRRSAAWHDDTAIVG